MMLHQPRTLAVAEEMRVLVGVAVQPFLAAAVAFVIFPMLFLGPHDETLAGPVATDPNRAAFSVALAVGLVAFFVTVIGALPAAVWLMKRQQVSLPAALLCGLAFGNLPGAIGFVLAGSHGLTGLAGVAMFGSILGLIGAAAFWAIALRRKPLEDPR